MTPTTQNNAPKQTLSILPPTARARTLRCDCCGKGWACATVGPTPTLLCAKTVKALEAKGYPVDRSDWPVA